MADKLQAAVAVKTLKPFIGHPQLSTMTKNCYGEEKQFFIDKLVEMAELIKNMPKTYEQDGKGDDAIVYLHYFHGSMDWYITEKDVDTDGEGQLQAFGLADMGYGAELGYISIEDIKEHVELDLHFKPRPLREVRS